MNRRYTIELDAGDGAGAAWLHAHGDVLAQSVEGDLAVYDVRMDERDYARFAQR